MFYKSKFQKERRKQEELVSAFDEFIQHIYWGEDLNSRTSIKNLEEGLVEITLYGQHSSNGLLITDDGYFLTAKHCVDLDLPKAGIRLHNGKTYKIEKVCAFKPKEDIALAKADIPERCEPKKYRFYNTNLLEKMPIAVLTRIDGKLVKYYGSIERAWSSSRIKQRGRTYASYENYFTILFTKSKPGDSGGIIISPDNRLVGILSSSDSLGYEACGTKLIEALKVVEFHKRKIQKRMEKK